MKERNERGKRERKERKERKERGKKRKREREKERESFFLSLSNQPKTIIHIQKLPFALSSKMEGGLIGGGDL
jgi:hypothetical protein